MPPDLRPLSSDDLRFEVDRKLLEFESTDELAPSEATFGQDRAMGAIDFGAEIDAPGFHIFIMGPEGTGRRRTILKYLKSRAVTQETPPDWVYVYDFSDHRRPQAMRLPAGYGLQLAAAMERFVTDVREGVPALFENEENQNRLRAIEEEFRQKPEEAFEALRERAADDNIALVRTPMGFGFAPLAGGEIIKLMKPPAAPEQPTVDSAHAVTRCDTEVQRGQRY